MAGTRNLDWLTHYARERGAVVRLLGDPAQLTSVEAGGALRLLAHDAGAVELTDLHRFTDPDEAKATIGLREGRPESLDYYLQHHRIHAGSTDAMLETAYHAWEHDTRAGISSLLIAQSSTDVTALNLRARTARTQADLVTQAGVELHDGTTAGVGHLIVTRRNHRRLTSRDGRSSSRTATPGTSNGSTTTATSQSVPSNTPRAARCGSRTATSHWPSSWATPPPPHAQGRTVDTAHVLIDQTTTREALYVAATRARTGAHLYVDNEHLVGLDAERPPAPTLDPMDQLAAVLTRETGQRTATEVQRQAQACATHQALRRRRAPTAGQGTMQALGTSSRRL